MGKFDGVLLASDFDNTLVDTETARKAGLSTPQVSQRNREALQYFMDNGGRFAIATGRALPGFIRFADQVPMNAPGIVCNGAVLYDFDQQKNLDTVLLDEAVLPYAQEVLDRFPTVALEAYHVDNMIYEVRSNEYSLRHIHVTNVDVEKRDSLSEVPVPLGKVIFEESHEALQQVKDWIDAQPWAETYEVIFSSPVILEITAKGANKGGMIRRLADHLGIAMEHVYCAGDEANDLSMLRVAAQGFAPANCTEQVRRSGATIVSHCSNDAMADIVALLDQRY